jgi:Ca2+-binding RTX toxin-like protein
MATLNVGAGQTYATLAAAVAASHDGDVVAVQAGTYVNDFATISTKISIVGVGGMANFVATTAPPNGKGILVTQTDVTIQNLSFSGAAVADGNGAGIRYEGGNLVIIDSYFHDNQDGLLSNADPNGTIRITGSEFANNGTGDGFTHNLYVGDIASLVIDDSYFHDAVVGHQVKSRAQSTTITNSRIYDGTGTGSYSIDLPNGGVGVIRDNVIQQGANSDNPAIIHYGGESAAYPGSSLTITDNVVVNDLTSSPSVRLLANATTVTASLSGNDVYGLTSSQIATGPATVSGTTFLSTHPSLDTSSPWLAGDPTIFGTPGPDTLAGTAGADTMSGGAGNDTYYVNNVGDKVIEAAGGGTDTVYSTVSWSMAAGQEIEYLLAYGPGAVSGVTLTGNELDNYLVGGSGHDVLSGGAGDDHLRGGAGADTMTGGAGNDTYYVDNIGDSVTEASNSGTDLVNSSINYTLGSNVEKLTLTGSGNLNGWGNSVANTLTGNSGNNVLYGAGGADVMAGGAGNDTYYVDNVGDSVTEASNAGTDLVNSAVSYALGNNVENLTLSRSANINGYGNSLANTLTGNSGNNLIDGGLGNDRLIGGGGSDTFAFHTIFNAIVGTGMLSAAQFAANTSGTAQDASDRIIYETDTGKLFYDSNGSAAGGATQFATLSPGLALTNADFSVV